MANEWTYRVQDAAVNPAAFALPTATNTTCSAQIDLGTASSSGLNARLEEMEFEIQAPALAVGELANGQTVTYNVEHSTASGGGYTTLQGSVVVQTGAGGAGAAAQTVRFRIPTSAYRYINVAAVAGAGAGNPSTSDCTVTVRF